MGNFMRLLSSTRRESAYQSEYEYMRKFRRESGLTMASFISSIHGEKAINLEKCLSTDSSLLKERRGLIDHRNRTFSAAD